MNDRPKAAASIEPRLDQPGRPSRGRSCRLRRWVRGGPRAGRAGSRRRAPGRRPSRARRGAGTPGRAGPARRRRRARPRRPSGSSVPLNEPMGEIRMATRSADQAPITASMTSSISRARSPARRRTRRCGGWCRRRGTGGAGSRGRRGSRPGRSPASRALTVARRKSSSSRGDLLEAQGTGGVGALDPRRATVLAADGGAVAVGPARRHRQLAVVERLVRRPGRRATAARRSGRPRRARRR